MILSIGALHFVSWRISRRCGDAGSRLALGSSGCFAGRPLAEWPSWQVWTFPRPLLNSTQETPGETVVETTYGCAGLLLGPPNQNVPT